MKNLLLLIFFSIFAIQNFAVAGVNGREAIKYLPIQNGGRIKPFDTFAQESLQLIFGKRKKSEKSATDIVLTMYMLPEMWADTKMVSLKNFELKRDLGLPEMESLFSFNEIGNSKQLPLILQKLRSKEQMKEKLNPYYQAIQKLENQIYLYRAIASGAAFTFVPPKPDATSSAWLPVFHSDPKMQKLFTDIASDFVQSVSAEVNKDKKADQGDVETKVKAFMDAARAENPVAYPSGKDINVEVFYNDLHPFMWAWILYLIAAGFYSASLLMGKKNWAYKLGWTVLGMGFLMHALGFGLRIYISGRPPVSNMYETVIWVAFGSLIFASIIERVTEYAAVILGGCLVASFCLILADLAPTILDPSLQPLEPVLVSNFWLIIHVMTISVSYAAFFLALALGNFGLFYFIRGADNHKQTIQNLTNGIYRAIQIGVVLLAAGIILGGIWADYSWGRFWGWDPKETWALIALLGYLAILHGRIGGWLRNFGLSAFSVIGFSLIIMAWYGVNFVLGAGLHTYGFGAGGIEYVLGFVVVELLFVTYATIVVKGGVRKSSPSL